jgi:hypothetical protein
VTAKRQPLSEEQVRVNAAALAAFPKGISPDDDEMRAVCESLVDRGLLNVVQEGDADELDPDADEVVGYLASEKSRAAMLVRAAMN